MLLRTPSWQLSRNVRARSTSKSPQSLPVALSDRTWAGASSGISTSSTDRQDEGARGSRTSTIPCWRSYDFYWSYFRWYCGFTVFSLFYVFFSLYRPRISFSSSLSVFCLLLYLSFFSLPFSRAACSRSAYVHTTSNAPDLFLSGALVLG